MQANTNTTTTTTATATASVPQKTTAAANGVKDEETKTFAERMATMERPNVDKRVKTEDVTATSGMTFRDFNLDDAVQFGVFEMGFELPSPIQEQAIPKILNNVNIIAKAKNGTGKTAAYGIPLVQKIDTSLNKIQALVLVPVRELAMQTSLVIKEIGKHKGVQCMVSTGGTRVNEDVIRMGQVVHVVVATPGRILDLATRGEAKLDMCKLIILDEVDRLISGEFQEVVQQIIEILPEQTQICLFSATYPVEIRSFQQRNVPSPEYIKITDELTLKGLTQYYAFLEEREKLHCLNTLFTKLDISQAIIFCNSAKRVELLARKISQLGYSCFFIHSRMDQRDRNRIFHDFKKGETRCLVSSDVFARGIDIISVNVVINFDFPRQSDTYLHRIGRSGRFGHLGLAINFICEEDKNNMFSIEDDLNTQIKPIPQDIDKNLYTI